MSNSVEMVREYLTRKDVTELRNALFKMEGGLARLNGSKADLIERVAHAFLGLPAGRQNEVLPGFHRARLNWQRTAHLASSVLRPPPPSAAAPATRPPRPSAAQPAPRLAAPPASRPTLNAPTSSTSRGRQPLRGGRSAGDVLRTDGGAGSLGDVRGPVPAGGQSDSVTPRPDWGSGSSEEAIMSTPIRRRRSRSMNPSPSKLLEEYKMKWTCKICLVAEVEVILQPCGHLCLCEPCSLSIRSHFVANRLRDLMFGEPVPRTPCPICRQPIVSSAKIFV